MLQLGVCIDDFLLGQAFATGTAAVFHLNHQEAPQIKRASRGRNAFQKVRQHGSLLSTPIALELVAACFDLPLHFI